MKDVAGFFKALSDEARVRILWLLLSHGELCVCDVMEALRITQSKASRHLTTLKHAGLVTDRREGTWSYYSLVPAASGLERAVLEALGTTLAGHAEAKALLRDLAAWLGHKGGCPTCTPPGKRPAATKRKSR